MKSINKKASLTFEDWKKVTEIYDELNALTFTERQALLSQYREALPHIISEVEELLQSPAPADFLEVPITREFANVLSIAKPKEKFEKGDVVGNFEILDTIGVGGFATIYLAREIPLDRLVALKVSSAAGNEGKNLASLEHPNIVPVYSQFIDEAKRQKFICMQYVKGLTLEAIIQELGRKGKLGSGQAILNILDEKYPEPAVYDVKAIKERELLASLDSVGAALWMGAKLCDALAYAHGKGVLHLDVKPQNIILDQYGRPMLADFNVSQKKQSMLAGLSESFGGTQGYMSPEQQAVLSASNKQEMISHVGERSDVYSLAIVIAELLGVEISTPVSQNDFNNPLRILKKATETDPSQRFPSARALGEAFHACFDLRLIERAMPARGIFGKMCDRYPLTTLTFFGFLPQWGSWGLITLYNSLCVARDLTPSQQHFFQTTSQTLTPIVFFTAALVWFRILRQLVPALREKGISEDSSERWREHRELALKLPWVGFFLTTAIWLSAAILYPYLIHRNAGPLTGWSVVHFVLSFAISWVFAFSYTFLFQQMIAIRDLYPRLLVRSPDVRLTAEQDLGNVSQWIKGSLLLVIISPLVATVMVVMSGPSRISEDYTPFKWLVIALLTLSFIGLIFLGKYAPKLIQLLYSYKNFRSFDDE